MELPQSVGAYTLHKGFGELGLSKVRRSSKYFNIFLTSQYQIFQARHVFSGRDVLVLAVHVNSFERGTPERNKLNLSIKSLRSASGQHMLRPKETFVSSQ